MRTDMTAVQLHHRNRSPPSTTAAVCHRSIDHMLIIFPCGLTLIWLYLLLWTKHPNPQNPYVFQSRVLHMHFYLIRVCAFISKEGLNVFIILCYLDSINSYNYTIIICIYSFVLFLLIQIFMYIKPNLIEIYGKQFSWQHAGYHLVYFRARVLHTNSYHDSCNGQVFGKEGS